MPKTDKLQFNGIRNENSTIVHKIISKNRRRKKENKKVLSLAIIVKWCFCNFFVTGNKMKAY